jgi:hypothetical protein
MAAPNAANAGFADSLRPGHTSGTPMRGVWGLGMQCRFNHGSNLFIANFGNTAWAGSIFFQSAQTQSQKALTPQLHRWSRDLQHFGNVLAIYSVGSHLDNLCTLDKPQWHRPATRPLVQSGAFFLGKYDSGGFSTHNARPYSNVNYMSSYL